MRIIVTSDTHHHPRHRKVLEKLVAEIASHQPDCVILAGDVGEQIEGYEAMLALVQEQINCPRLVLTGNHDLWARDGIDSAALWTKTLPELTHQYGAIWLEARNWSQASVGVCGTNGWYDYSGSDPAQNITDEQYFRSKHLYVADGQHVRWDWTDTEFATMIGGAFSVRLAALDADPNIREVLVVTHVPTFEETIVRKPNSPDWNIRNAYFYNLGLGNRIVASPKVTGVISGHTHVGITTQVVGPSNVIQVRVLPADYGKPAYAIVDYSPRMSIKIFTVNP